MVTIERAKERVAPPEVAPARGHHRRDIQGLRAIAVLLVVAFHAGLPLKGGYVGVDAFFVISGVVITTLLWGELERTSRLDFLTFYARRVRRLLPALAVLVVVVVGCALVFQNPLTAQHDAASAGRFASVFVANFHFAGARTGYFDAVLNNNPFLHTWSLAVEEQFYLLFPLVLVVAFHAARRVVPGDRVRSTTAGIIAAGMLGSFALSWLLTNDTAVAAHVHNASKVAFYSAPTRAWEFGAGALLALLAPAFSRIGSRAAVALGVAGAALLGYSAVAFTSTTPFPGTAALWPVAGTALMLLAGLRTSEGVTRILATKPLVAIGDISYGWYLWHWPVIVFARLAFSGSTVVLTTAAIVSLLPTILSYQLVEQPIRFPKSSPRRGAPRVAFVCIGVPLLVTTLAGAAATQMSHTPTVKAFAEQARFHADVTHHCDSTAAIEKRPAGCTWKTTGATGSIWLLGDSNAGQFIEPVARAAAQSKLDLTAAPSSECPFVDLVLVRSGTPYQACRTWVTGAMASMQRDRPAVVVLASWGSGYIHDSKYRFRDPRTGKRAVTQAQKAAMWEAAYASTLRAVVAAGARPVVVHTIPRFATWRLDDCAAARIFAGIERCGRSATRASIAEQQRLALGAEQRAADAVGGVEQLDFAGDLCTRTACSTNRGSFFLYRDGSHLSVDGALTLTDRFSKALESRSST